jgi:hypothetical protein
MCDHIMCLTHLKVIRQGGNLVRTLVFHFFVCFQIFKFSKLGWIGLDWVGLGWIGLLLCESELKYGGVKKCFGSLKL